jgi:hypothetical protein
LGIKSPAIAKLGESNMNIRDQLLAATGVKPKADEDPQALYKRIVNKAQGLDDKVWSKLSEEAQNWVNDGVGAIEDEKPIADLPGEPEGEGDAGETAGEATSGEETGRRRRAKAKEPAAAANEEKAPAASKGKTKAKETAAANGDKKAKGRPRLDAATVVKRKRQKLPEEGHRNKFWDQVPDGTKLADLRKNKPLLRAARYWRRKGFVDFVVPKAEKAAKAA